MSFHTKSFIVHAPLNTVWKAYNSVNPNKAWGGNMLDFSCQYSRSEERTYYKDDANFPNLKVGEMVFLNVKIVGGIKQLAVGHEIVDVNENAKTITTCYLENSVSSGSQTLRFIEVDRYTTKIVHDSRYASGDWLRDQFLYPFFHTLTISEFHKNMKSYIEE